MGKIDDWQAKIKELESKETSVRTELQLLEKEYGELSEECEELGTDPEKIDDEIRKLYKRKGVLEKRMESMLDAIEEKFG